MPPLVDFYCKGCNKFITRHEHSEGCEQKVVRLEDGQIVEEIGEMDGPVKTDHIVDE